jgi:hypothetical protein
MTRPTQKGEFMLVRFALVAACVSLVLACSSQSDPEPTSQTDEQALTGGCRLTCPKCHPGQECPMIACTEDCNGKPLKCVDNQMCPIGYSWSSSKCSCVTTK